MTQPLRVNNSQFTDKYIHYHGSQVSLNLLRFWNQPGSLVNDKSTLINVMTIICKFNDPVSWSIKPPLSPEILKSTALCSILVNINPQKVYSIIHDNLVIPLPSPQGLISIKSNRQNCDFCTSSAPYLEQCEINISTYVKIKIYIYIHVY